MYKIDDNNVPAWAKEIFTNKGLGFEDYKLHSFVWGYYVSQFAHMDIEQAEHEQYFSHMLSKLIKEGSIDKAIQQLKEVDLNELESSKPSQRPPRLSAMAIFEQKVRNYLGDEDFDMFSLVDESPFLGEKVQPEEDLLWEAYQALLTEDKEKKEQVICKLKQYFSVSRYK